MTPRTVLILCERAPEPVPAVRYVTFDPSRLVDPVSWKCSYCGRRVRVVA